MERYILFHPNNFYHIYNRGVDKRKIFFSKGDWTHFQRLLYLCNNDDDIKINLSRLKNKPLLKIDRKETLVDIVAYAMMDNHFHLVLHEKKDGGITKFMRKLLTSYAMYMNRKYNRTGPLMCRPFRAKYVDSDEYFRWLLSYVHMNPIDQIEPDWKENGITDKKTALKFLREYKYSSYPDYFVGKRDESLIINKKAPSINIADLEDLSEMLEQIGQYEVT